MKQLFDPRQVMSKDDFEIFHYSEPRNSPVEVHHHDFYEICMLLEGDVQYWVDGNTFSLMPGEMILINPMELHKPVVNPKPMYERIILWINKDYLKSLSSSQTDLTKCFDMRIVKISSELRETVMKLVNEYYSAEDGGDLGSLGLLLQFMVRLRREVFKTKLGTEGTEDTLTARVLSYINDNYDNQITLDSLAKKFYVSKYYLSHQFRDEVGVSVYRYIMIKRLLAAKHLLENGTPAGEVCDLVGFRDYAGFYRAFKAEYGTNPKTAMYRQDPATPSVRLHRMQGELSAIAD